MNWQSTFGKVNLTEQVFTNHGKLIRPFSSSANVKCRGYSMPLQRVVTDFGADVSFEETSKKAHEHYGLTLPASTIRLVVEKHAKKIEKNINTLQQQLLQKEPVDVIIAQMDGGMVPLVEIQNDATGDRRKTRKTSWGENRLALAYAKGTVDPIYATTMGSIDEAGQQLDNVVKLAGQGEKTHIHALGDGTIWIADKVEEHFGANATFTLDIFHLSEYLHMASKCISPKDPVAWARLQQERMKRGEKDQVLFELERHLDEGKHEDTIECHANKTYQYMIKRSNQFGYKDAIANDLPIGSGEIESGHRSVIQKRLKIAGGWWLKENASAIGNLRVLRANGCWQNYWKNESF